jgi:hypothetical protein
MSQPVPVTQAATPPAEPPDRHPLNLPRGTVRTGLVLLILLPFLILILSPERLVPMPLYLYFLLGLVLVFFASHGAEATEDSESAYSWLGRVVLFLLLAGTMAAIVYRLVTNPDVLRDRLTPNTNDPDLVGRVPYLLLATMGGYALGWLMSHLLGDWRYVYWWQDVQASVSLLAMFLLTGALFFTIFISSQLEKNPNTIVFECILLGVVAWYFGARS